MEELNAGIKLHVIQTAKFKSVIFCVLIRRPLLRQEATINALIPNIMKRGSAKYDTLSKINNAIEDMYGSVFESQVIKKGEEQILQFYLETINKGEEIYIKAVDFLSEIILHPLVENNAFCQAYTKGEIDNLRQGIQKRINNKSEYAKLKCLEIMCKDEPFGIYGDGYLEDLDSLDAGKLYAHYKTLIETSPIEFICIGDINGKPLKDIINEHFKMDGIERNHIIPIPRAEFAAQQKEPEMHEEAHGSVQGKLSIGCRSGIEPVGENFYKLLYVNEILGGGPNSRLFSQAREKESLCYTIHSFVYRFKTIIMIQSGMDPNHFTRGIELVKQEIENIKTGHVSDEEFTSAKRSLVKKFKGIQDYPSSTMDFYISQYMLEDSDRLEDVINRLETVEKDTAFAAAGGIVLDTIMMLR